MCSRRPKRVLLCLCSMMVFFCLADSYLANIHLCIFNLYLRMIQIDNYWESIILVSCLYFSL